MENVNITPGKGNCIEFIHRSNTLKELRSGELWRRCVIHIFDIFIVNLFALLILISVTLIIVQQLRLYGVLLADLAVLVYFIYFENSSKPTSPGKKWINRIVSSFEGKRILFERIFVRYCAGGVPGLFLVVIDVATNGLLIASEHLGFYFLIPIVTCAPVLFMDLRQAVNHLLTGKIFIKKSTASPALSLAGNEE